MRGSQVELSIWYIEKGGEHWFGGGIMLEDDLLYMKTDCEESILERREKD